MDRTLGFLAPVIISSIIFILNVLLPGRWVTGYVNKTNTDEKMRYHLNGILVFFTVILSWFLLGYFNIVPYDWLYDYRWYGLAGAFLAGIIFSLAVVLNYPPIRKSFLSDLFFGRIENIKISGGRADARGNHTGTECSKLYGSSFDTVWRTGFNRNTSFCNFAYLLHC
jgi:hypothetical protein